MLRLTGERTLPGIDVENYWFRRHEAAYLAVAPLCHEATVLEVGAGEGYGADLIASVAARTVTLDYDAATARHLRAAYPRLAAVRGNAVQLPFAAGAFDVVVCLQVIEHLWDQPALVAECARVLTPDGLLLVSTPNRLTFPRGNLFHPRELSGLELTDVLAARFDITRRYGLSHGPRLWRLDRQHDGGLVGAQLAAAPEAWSAALRTDVAGIRAADFVLAEADVDDSLDLLFVATRRP